MNVSPEGGTIKVNETTPSSYPASYEFSNGTSVHLEVVPASGYLFDNWSGDLSGNTSLTTIMIDCDKEVIANFSKVMSCWWRISGVIASVVVIGVISWFLIRGRKS